MVSKCKAPRKNYLESVSDELGRNNSQSNRIQNDIRFASKVSFFGILWKTFNILRRQKHCCFEKGFVQFVGWNHSLSALQYLYNSFSFDWLCLWTQHFNIFYNSFNDICSCAAKKWRMGISYRQICQYISFIISVQCWHLEVSWLTVME